MSYLYQPGQAGTLESNDIMITVAPAESENGITIGLISPVMKQYGNKIREAIISELTTLGISAAKVQANDKGALDCTIRARVKTAVTRASKQEME